jgi:hypothetical protein
MGDFIKRSHTLNPLSITRPQSTRTK